MPAFPPLFAHGSPTQLLLFAGYIVCLIGLSVGLVVAGVRLRRRDSRALRRLGVGLIALGCMPAWAVAIATLVSLFRRA